MGTASDGATDGRQLRRLRNEEAVVDAALDLLTEGVVQPTAQEVSERSGVSMRSIFRLFQDIEALHAAAIERQIERVAPLLGQLPTTGPLDQRVRALVEDRARFFDSVAPVRRFAVRLAPRSRAIQVELARADRFFRDQVARVFGTELGGPQSRDELLDALDAATSWEAWDRLRRAQGLSTERAQRVLAVTLSALLADATDDPNLPPFSVS